MVAWEERARSGGWARIRSVAQVRKRVRHLGQVASKDNKPARARRRLTRSPCSAAVALVLVVQTRAQVLVACPTLVNSWLRSVALAVVVWAALEALAERLSSLSNHQRNVSRCARLSHQHGYARVLMPSCLSTQSQLTQLQEMVR